MKILVPSAQLSAPAVWGALAWPEQLDQRHALVLAELGAAGAGLALNLDWLAAIGVAPALVSLLPCAAMCALGLCMHGETSGSCSSRSADGVEAAVPDASRLRSLAGPTT